MIHCRTIGLTQSVVPEIDSSENIVSYCARVSNPSNQTQFNTSKGLLAYCIKNAHWSIFETVSLTMEIQCPRDIARQILRHKSFSFQEFSQRYAVAQSFTTRECRLQDTSNRQNSTLNDDPELAAWWKAQQELILEQVQDVYEKALSKGIAKEVARVILPEGLTMSTMYMNGTLRSWLHYIDLRTGNGTQKEHMLVAHACKKELEKYFPSAIAALGGLENIQD